MFVATNKGFFLNYTHTIQKIMSSKQTIILRENYGRKKLQINFHNYEFENEPWMRFLQLPEYEKM